jgi:hypothetical protein
VLCLAATSDARKVFAGSHDGSVHAWSSEGTSMGKIEALSGTLEQPTSPDRSRSKEVSRNRNPNPKSLTP